MTVHEPATLITDYLLALLGMVCGWRLGRFANPAQRWWSRALWLSGAAAAVGGTHHGFGPQLGEAASDALWRATLLLISLTSAAMSLTLVQEFAPEPQRRVQRLDPKARVLELLAGQPPKPGEKVGETALGTMPVAKSTTRVR